MRTWVLLTVLGILLGCNSNKTEADAILDGLGESTAEITEEAVEVEAEATQETTEIVEESGTETAPDSLEDVAPVPDSEIAPTDVQATE